MVAEPTTTIGGPGRAYHLGREGEVVFTFANSGLTGRANVCFEVEEDSLPTRYGITNFPSLCFPRVRGFHIGNVDFTVEPLSRRWRWQGGLDRA